VCHEHAATAIALAAQLSHGIAIVYVSLKERNVLFVEIGDDLSERLVTLQSGAYAARLATAVRAYLATREAADWNDHLHGVGLLKRLRDRRRKIGDTGRFGDCKRGWKLNCFEVEGASCKSSGPALHLRPFNVAVIFALATGTKCAVDKSWQLVLFVTTISLLTTSSARYTVKGRRLRRDLFA
jgi:hypothetical protein